MNTKETQETQAQEEKLNEVKQNYAWGVPNTACGTECSASSGDGCHGDGECGGDGE